MFPSAISRYLVSNLKSILRDIGGILFPSAISRYLVSNEPAAAPKPEPAPVSIRYIAVLGFQLEQENIFLFERDVSIRYIAVLGFQRGYWLLLCGHIRFPSAISRYLVSNVLHDFLTLLYLLVSIRYIAVLGFQRTFCSVFLFRVYGFHPLYRGTWFPTTLRGNLFPLSCPGFHPLYRGTWFPTLPEKHPL